MPTQAEEVKAFIESGGDAAAPKVAVKNRITVFGDGSVLVTDGTGHEETECFAFFRSFLLYYIERTTNCTS
jgi:hypothetical protein